MSTERLLEVYERIAEAPDAIVRMRQFVLDLAVRGKLVEQDAADEPASQLFSEALTVKKAAGVKHKSDPVIGDDVSFPAPSGWLWTRVGEISLQTGSGSTPRGGRSAYTDTGTPFLRSQNVYDDGLRLDDVVFINEETNEKMKRTQVKAKDLLLNITGGSIGRCCRIPDEFGGANVSQHVAIIRTAARDSQGYLHLLIRSPFFQEFVLGEQTGAGRGGLPKNRMDRIPVPLPPLAEQRRIVARVDELMGLCDRLEEARVAREDTRDKLTAASLTRLTAPETSIEEFPAHAQFALDALPSITSRPEQIKTLRQTILNLAVHGKLVGCRSGSFEKVGSYRKLQNGYAFKSGWFTKSGIRLLRNANIGHGNVRWAETVYLPDEMASEYERFALTEGDIVLTLDRPFIVTGTKVAKITAADLPSLLLQRVGRFVSVKEGLSDDYLFMWITSPHFNDQIDPGRSNGVPHISSKQVEAAKIFVPSLTEQHHIVAKVDALMALCDRLEVALTTADATRSRLLEALLHEALEPTTGALEAAE